jgi:hypothetical protein
MKNLILPLLLFFSASISAQCLTKCINQSANIQWQQTDAAGSIIPNDPANTYDWTLTIPFTGDGTATIAIASVGAVTGNFPVTVEVTNAQGCIETFTYCIDVIQGTAVFNPVVVCANSTIDLAALATPPGGTFSGPGVTGTTFDPAFGSGPITYDVTANGCSVSATVNPTINPAPTGVVNGN